MLHEVKNAGWVQVGLFRKRHQFAHGGYRTAGITTDGLNALLLGQMQSPALVMQILDRQYWLYRNKTYWDEQGLAPEDVAALVFEKEQRRTRALQRAHEAVRREGTSEPQRRGPLPREIRRAVWERDDGKCVECGSRFDLQYDHVLPHSLGGATTVDNLQLLCQPCNLRKGASL